ADHTAQDHERDRVFPGSGQALGGGSVGSVSDGYGDGHGYGDGYVDGSGYGDGIGYGYGDGSGRGYGYGYGDGDVDGSGYGYGDGYWIAVLGQYPAAHGRSHATTDEET